MTKAIATPALRRPARLVDEVYDAIYSRLMSLAIPPGGRLSVDSLVRELGVSQTPIREALSRLEAQGLVVKTHLIGYSAAGQMDREQFEQLYEMRLLLEPFAASQAAGKLDAEARTTLTRIDATMRAMKGQIDHTRYSDYARHDGDFHDVIARVAGNAILSDTLARLHTHVHLFRLHYHSHVTTAANEEHERILAALVAGDAEAAGEAMREHILRSRDRFIAVFASRPEIPAGSR